MTSTPIRRDDSAESAGTPCDHGDGVCGIAAIGRRGLLRTAGIAGVLTVAGGGLSACGNILSPNEHSAADDAQPTQPTPTGAATTRAATKSAAPMGAPPASEPTKTAGSTMTQLTGTFLARANAIPVNGGVIFSAHRVVVTQPTAGTYKAFSTTCTHAGCQCDQVADGQISCPCHGAVFSITDGSAVQGPTSTPLPARTIAVQDGQIRLQA